MVRDLHASDIIETSVLHFYGWWQFSVCLFAFMALMAIWWHIGRKQGDFGQVWLALSVFCWSLSGAFEIGFSLVMDDDYKKLESYFRQSNTHQPELVPSLGPPPPKDIETSIERISRSNHILEGFRSILSLFNSLFILLALPWFRYIPARIKPLIKSNIWPLLIGLPFAFSILPTITSMISNQSTILLSQLDVYYALLTLIFLGWVLWASFAKRRLFLLACLSIVCIFITLIAQFYKLFGSDINLTLFSAIFKTSLIMLFFALALSWVKELSEVILPSAERLFLSLSKNLSDRGKWEYTLNLQGYPDHKLREVQLSQSNYFLLEKFVTQKIADGQGWLEIKPKSDKRSSKQYDIRDHNELKRLLHSILDGLLGKQLWTNEHHLAPFKASFFETADNQSRKIRLKPPTSNLSLE